MSDSAISYSRVFRRIELFVSLLSLRMSYGCDNKRSRRRGDVEMFRVGP